MVTRPPLLLANPTVSQSWHPTMNGVLTPNDVTPGSSIKVWWLCERGHEWQAQFHWHVEDQGIRHVYIKPRSPQLNGKVERSHRSDQEEFYQLLAYTDDVDLKSKLASWEEFYNFNRPHGAHQGGTPYEALKSKLALPGVSLG